MVAIGGRGFAGSTLVDQLRHLCPETKILNLCPGVRVERWAPRKGASQLQEEDG